MGWTVSLSPIRSFLLNPQLSFQNVLYVPSTLHLWFRILNIIRIALWVPVIYTMHVDNIGKCFSFWLSSSPFLLLSHRIGHLPLFQSVLSSPAPDILVAEFFEKCHHIFLCCKLTSSYFVPATVINLVFSLKRTIFLDTGLQHSIEILRCRSLSMCTVRRRTFRG